MRLGIRWAGAAVAILVPLTTGESTVPAQPTNTLVVGLETLVAFADETFQIVPGLSLRRT